MFDDGVHHRPPAHAQLGRHLRHRPGLLAHLSAGFGPGAAGEHGLGVDEVGVLRPRLGVAVGVGAAPPAFDPSQPRRAAEASEVSNVDRLAVLRLGPHAAAFAADHRGHGLDGDHQLVGSFGDLEHPEAVQSQERLGQPTTVAHRQGSPVVVAVR